MTKDIYKTDKGHEIEITEKNMVRVPLRTATDKKAIQSVLDHSISIIESGKVRVGSLREKLALGRIEATKQRLTEI